MYYISTDTALITNNQFTVIVDSFSLISLKLNYTELANSINNKIESESYFNLYPNPTTYQVNVKTSFLDSIQWRLFP